MSIITTMQMWEKLSEALGMKGRNIKCFRLTLDPTGPPTIELTMYIEDEEANEMTQILKQYELKEKK